MQGLVKRETCFTSKCPANEIMSKIEETAKPMGFNVHKRNYKVLLYFLGCSMPHKDDDIQCLVSLSKIFFSWLLLILSLLQMKLQGDRTGRKGQLAVATEVWFTFCV